MTQIIVVNGFPGCGKTSFENFCIKKLAPYGDIYSTVDFVKQIAEKCGWKGEKDLKARKFLSDLKDLLTEWNDIPFKKTESRAVKFSNELAAYGLYNDAYLFVDCREPKEIQRFCDELGAVSLLIRRPGNEPLKASNHADANVLDYHYDFVIENDGDLDDLEVKADEFLDLIKAL